MKKILALILTLALTVCALSTFVSCNKNDEYTIRIAASPTPHAEILEIAKDILAEQGYTLEIVTFDDYVLPNNVVFSGEFDANYFQHVPYLNSFNSDNNMNLVSVAAIHYEPFGIYANGITLTAALNSTEEVTVFIPSDDSNQTRALLLLAQEGFLTIPEGKDINTGINILDLTEANYLSNIKLVAVEASTAPAQLRDSEGTLAVINGNYAIGAGLNVATDALAIEAADGQAASTYANIIAVRPDSVDSPKILALIEALQSDEVKDFIESAYEGAVVVAKN